MKNFINLFAFLLRQTPLSAMAPRRLNVPAYPPHQQIIFICCNVCYGVKY